MTSWPEINLMKVTNNNNEDRIMIGGKNWAMPSLGVLTYLKNKKKSISQKVQIQKRVRKMDFGNDSAKFGGGCCEGGVGGFLQPTGAGVADYSSQGARPPTHRFQEHKQLIIALIIFCFPIQLFRRKKLAHLDQ